MNRERIRSVAMADPTASKIASYLSRIPKVKWPVRRIMLINKGGT
jgi:hypothetical protein